MDQKSLKRRALPLTLAAVGAGSALASSPVLAASSVTYKGSTVGERWGTVRVWIVVKSKKITNVKASASVHAGRSQFITSNALPQLKQEVLQAQSASIDTVSGATDLSRAYITSLQAAVKKAIKAKTLPARAL